MYLLRESLKHEREPLHKSSYSEVKDANGQFDISHIFRLHQDLENLKTLAWPGCIAENSDLS